MNQIKWQRSVIRDEMYESMSEVTLLRKSEQGDCSAEAELQRRRRMEWATIPAK
ncbi:hypothetical protein [Robertmurraya sp.]|uniref:hypothetical protein n=1 Tax=Robertmurraya sp. TaxID=2837525 RepID=UPI003703A5C1